MQYLTTRRRCTDERDCELFEHKKQMGVYLLSARSTKGKSVLFKRICSEIQKQIHKTPLIIWWVGDYDEMADMKKNKNTHCHFFPKEKLDGVLKMVYDPTLKDIPKILFIDDASTLSQSEKNNQIMRLISTCRHYSCDAFIANHYLNSLPINIKSNITDYALWAPIAANKLKDFYEFCCADSFNCQAPSHEMDFGKFVDRFQREVSHSDMPRDDPRQKAFYHNFAWLSFPTMFDARATMLMNNEFDLKNSVCANWEKDKALDEEAQTELAQAAALQQEPPQMVVLPLPSTKLSRQGMAKK